MQRHENTNEIGTYDCSFSRRSVLQDPLYERLPYTADIAQTCRWTHTPSTDAHSRLRSLLPKRRGG